MIIALCEHALDLIRRLEDSVGRALVGKPEVIRLAVIGLLARGHLLIEDVPGVGKTTLAARAGALASAGASSASSSPPTCCPPTSWASPSTSADRGDFVFKPGPLFANIVLADEINRTTPKTQSSLLEAMNEAQVSLDHSTYPLPKPFMVLATQNPLEYEGTHAAAGVAARPLPAAHPHRLSGARPTRRRSCAAAGGGGAGEPDAVLTAAEVLELQEPGRAGARRRTRCSTT